MPDYIWIAAGAGGATAEERASVGAARRRRGRMRTCVARAMAAKDEAVERDGRSLTALELSLSVATAAT